MLAATVTQGFHRVVNKLMKDLAGIGIAPNP